MRIRMDADLACLLLLLQLWEAVPAAQAQHRHQQARVQPLPGPPAVPGQVQVGAWVFSWTQWVVGSETHTPGLGSVVNINSMCWASVACQAMHVGAHILTAAVSVSSDRDCYYSVSAPFTWHAVLCCFVLCSAFCSRDGQLIPSSVAGAGGAGGAATPGGGGGGNAFTMYVKTHFAEIKRALPTGTPHKEVMTRLAAQYKEQKLTATAATPATATRPARKVTVTAVTAELVVTQTPAAPRTASRGGATAAAAAAEGASLDDEDGWQTADEEVEEQTTSLLSFMDRLALS